MSWIRTHKHPSHSSWWGYQSTERTCVQAVRNLTWSYIQEKGCSWCSDCLFHKLMSPTYHLCTFKHYDQRSSSWLVKQHICWASQTREWVIQTLYAKRHHHLVHQSWCNLVAKSTTSLDIFVYNSCCTPYCCTYYCNTTWPSTSIPPTTTCSWATTNNKCSICRCWTYTTTRTTSSTITSSRVIMKSNHHFLFLIIKGEEG